MEEIKRNEDAEKENGVKDCEDESKEEKNNNRKKIAKKEGKRKSMRK